MARSPWVQELEALVGPDRVLSDPIDLQCYLYDSGLPSLLHPETHLPKSECQHLIRLITADKPTYLEWFEQKGIDISREPMEVSISAMNSCGGVGPADGAVVDADSATTLPGLFAAGDSSRLIARAALERRESRLGLYHNRTDYPERDDANWKKFVILKRQGDGIGVCRMDCPEGAVSILFTPPYL